MKSKILMKLQARFVIPIHGKEEVRANREIDISEAAPIKSQGADSIG